MRWIRTLAVLSSVLVLLWFLEDVAFLNYHLFFGPSASAYPWFSPGFGIGFLVLGTVLSALGLSRVGLGAVMGAGIGYIFLFTPLGLFAFIIGTLTCIIGALVGWWIQRASSKSVRVTSS